MDSELDTRMMARALQQARQGKYSAMPNPHVGCVLVRGGQVIGEGYTQPAGGNHAEIEALAAAGDAQGATAYVTLEPCSHQGKTGPCADALITAGVSRVVAAMEDPNPEVSGRGLEKLRAAGITVSTGLLEGEARAVIPGFIARMSRGRPRVRAKLAMSLDGRTAMASGESQWITGAAARRDVQRLRAMSCAIVTGVGTVLADDCSLTVRADELGMDEAETRRATQRQPVRVVLDSGLRTPADARVLAGAAPTLLFHGAGQAIPKALLARGDSLQGLPLEAGRLDLVAMVNALCERQCNEILVESGPRLAGALLQAGLLDELIIYMAPTLMGDRARPLLELPLDSMSEKVPLAVQDVRKIGEDFRFTVVPA
ncbi:MAG: bifunctional diaminohydroxyphosphoribosylaminopyrimidine deaminase/5-amino-6-(5-phosphoribosylamino)uracil reductase RibD [Halioglobus sp.]